MKWLSGPPIIQQALAEQKRTCRLVALEAASGHIVNVTYAHKVVSNFIGKQESSGSEPCNHHILLLVPGCANLN